MGNQLEIIIKNFSLEEKDKVKIKSEKKTKLKKQLKKLSNKK